MSRFARLAAAGATPAEPAEGEVLGPGPAAPSRLHALAHETVAAVLDKVTAGADSLPLQYRAIFTMVRGTMVPTILARLDATPEDELRAHLISVRDRIDAALLDCADAAAHQ